MTLHWSDTTQPFSVLAPYRQFRRLLVRFRISAATVPLLLLLLWLGVMVGLSRGADGWIVFLAATPLGFAGLLTLLCWLAYRRDFYA
jgi:hypothetical protein